MRIVELIIDENNKDGIQAMSVVEHPAIESDFVALAEQRQEVKFKAIDNEKRLLLGMALIPDKMIYRKNGDDEYYIYFSKDTIRKASEHYLSQGKQNNSTIEHQKAVEGLSIVESWIVEDKEKDKLSLYGIEPIVGSWAIAMKVYNDEIWNDYVKTGKVKGFSIEAYFTEKADEKKLSKEQAMLEEIKRILIS